MTLGRQCDQPKKRKYKITYCYVDLYIIFEITLQVLCENNTSLPRLQLGGSSALIQCTLRECVFVHNKSQQSNLYLFNAMNRYRTVP